MTIKGKIATIISTILASRIIKRIFGDKNKDKKRTV